MSILYRFIIRFVILCDIFLKFAAFFLFKKRNIEITVCFIVYWLLRTLCVYVRLLFGSIQVVTYKLESGALQG